MTLREKLADWITGGDFTREKIEHAETRHLSHIWFERSGQMQIALMHIIAADTPKGNATVKRMVRIAREAL
jgi:hypothetical protein